MMNGTQHFNRGSDTGDLYCDEVISPMCIFSKVYLVPTFLWMTMRSQTELTLLVSAWSEEIH